MSTAALLSIDWMLRGITVGMLLMIAFATAREHFQLVAARLAILVSIGTIGYVICSGPGSHPVLGWCLPPLLALTGGNNVAFWLFASALFDDNFRLRWGHVALWGLMVVLGGVECLANSRTLTVAMISSSILFALLAVVPTLATWRNDLLENRRRLRLFIVIASATYTALTAIANLTGDITPNSGPNLLVAAALVGIVAPIAFTTLGLRPTQSLFATLARPVAVPALEAPPASPPAEAVNPAQVAALERAMTVDRAYRQDGLTIARLADRLGLPEYRLRRLINQALGYRNFNAFLNDYRIADAKAALADPTQADVPVLTIALDAGFSSLGPFNRAFKAETGMTPTDFRRGGSPIPNSASDFPDTASRISPAR
ncbi:MAG TPA: helix-turn-helix domain-containing protein [Reyranella sp.]|nr:helix-turn-helix domain-containing protein [Reyranella sp.]